MNLDLTTAGSMALIAAFNAEYPEDWALQPLPPTTNANGQSFRVWISRVQGTHTLTLKSDGTWFMNTGVHP